MIQSITASHTTRALRHTVYPLLKNAGFDDWTTRKAWRRRGTRIDHVEFRSFNSYFADTQNCTPASVNVWMGILIPELGIERAVRPADKTPRPHEAAMPIRGTIHPSIGLRQRNELGIWNIYTERDAEESAADIAMQFEAYALGWLDSSFDIQRLISFLRDNPSNHIQTQSNGSHLWVDVGNLDSPNRNSMLANLAVATLDFAAAAEYLERSRWAINQKTGVRFLFRSPDEDAEIRRMAAEYASKAHNARS